MVKTTLKLQNNTKICNILAGNHKIRAARKFEIRGVLRPYSVRINRVSRGPPVVAFQETLPNAHVFFCLI